MMFNDFPKRIEWIKINAVWKNVKRELFGSKVIINSIIIDLNFNLFLLSFYDEIILKYNLHN